MTLGCVRRSDMGTNGSNWKLRGRSSRCIRNRKPKSSRPPKTISIGFQVKDLDGTVAKLKKLGVTFKIQDEGFLRRADFAEPDGHRLYLMEVR